ncbi:MAG: hypothetical protein KKG47_14660 [Proteobacteria bacterium]|nr:hypothetical protein [Pseudomonadota bacterium]MBU1738187.1 hypothetical protein [Pseudomonadota bacterium]
MKYFYLALFCLCVLFSPGCTRHTIESTHDVTLQPVEIKPIHITIDVNIKVDKALDDFFSDIDAAK